MSIAELIGDEDVDVTGVGTAEAALEAIQARRFDCAIVDLGLPDLPGAELIERIRKTKGGEQSADRGLHGPGPDEGPGAAAREHCVHGHRQGRRDPPTGSSTRRRCSCIGRSPACRSTSRSSSSVNDDSELQGRKVLIVDDDVRNIFSLTSALEQNGMEVVFAENGREGIELSKATPDIDVMLVDIMMPEMDGYETMRAIRKSPAYHAPAPCGRHRQGHEGRSGEVPRGGRHGLRFETCGHRPTSGRTARSVGTSRMCPMIGTARANGAAEAGLRT